MDKRSIVKPLDNLLQLSGFTNIIDDLIGNVIKIANKLTPSLLQKISHRRTQV